MPTFKYTDKQRKELLDSMVVLVDTREQRNDHIIATLNEKKIVHICKKLDFGDYSVMLPKNETLAIPHDLYFTDDITTPFLSSMAIRSESLSRLPVHGPKMRVVAGMVG